MMTTILVNGRIYLERDRFAEALLIEDGMITKVGTTAEIEGAAPAGCERIDAQGRTVVPGFNDSHLHLHGLGSSLNSVLLAGVSSMEELIERGRAFIRDHKVPAGAVVTGRGWNQDYFTDGVRLPTRFDLDKISTEHPILFTRACGHMNVCNTKALEVAGVTAATPQPAGAAFDVDETGAPLGIFREIAQGLVEKIIPPLTRERMEENIRAAVRYASSHGITSVQTNDVRNENYREMLGAYGTVEKAGDLALRVYHQCCFYDPTYFERFIADGHRTGAGSSVNKIGPLKLFVDGSLGARTALMRADYADEAGTRGITVLTQEQLDALVGTADKNGIQVAIHAIGDRAIEMVLDSYDKVVGSENKLRHGIIHCQITDRPLLERFAAKDILAYVQPIFIHYDMHVVADRVGAALASTSYAFGSMGKMGIHVSYGTDCPVEDLSPMNNIYCAVARKDLSGKPEAGYFPGEAVDIFTAMDHYTVHSAYCSFEEGKKGRLQPGYYADLAILDRDIFTIPTEEIRSTQVMTTMMGGQVVFLR